MNYIFNYKKYNKLFYEKKIYNILKNKIKFIQHLYNYNYPYLY